MRSGRRADALVEAKQALDTRPEDAAACVLAARLQPPDAARKLLEKAVALDPKLATAWRELARVHEDAGRLAEGVAAMERAVALRGSASHWNALGWLRERAGTSGGALDAYRAAIAADPSLSLARENLALLLSRLGRGDEAVREALAATQAAPRRGAAWIALGLVRAGAKDYAGAAEAYEKALEVSPTDTVALLSLGRAYRRLERFDLAERALRRAAEAAPDDAAVSVDLGLLEMDRGDLPAAETYLRAAAKQVPKDGRPHYLLGLAADRAGRADDALKEYLKAAALAPDEGPYHLAAGFAYERKARLPEALRCFEKAAESMPADPRPLAGQAAILQKQGKAKDAASRYERAVEMAPADRNLRLLLAILYADGLRDDAKAAPHFAKYLALGGSAETIAPWYTGK